jgi:hypothetical protein
MAAIPENRAIERAGWAAISGAGIAGSIDAMRGIAQSRELLDRVRVPAVCWS